MLGDSTFLMAHDVLELVDSAGPYTERVQISGDPTSTLNVTVVRGVAGYTPSATFATATTKVNLIGNSVRAPR